MQRHVAGDPYGNRTHVCGVRGRRLNRLTNGPYTLRIDTRLSSNKRHTAVWYTFRDSNPGPTD